MATRRMYITISGFYDVDLDEAESDYGTTDPYEMLAIDLKNAQKDPYSTLDLFGIEDPKVALSWEN